MRTYLVHKPIYKYDKEKTNKSQGSPNPVPTTDMGRGIQRENKKHD